MALSKILPAGQAQFAGARNLIINGSMICSQRGTSTAYSANTSRGYVLDRWYGEGYPLNATIAQSTLAYDGITYECASLSSITGTYYFYQAIEDGVKYNKGKNLVLSFVASGSGNIQCQYNAGTVGTVNLGSAITLTGTPTKYSVAFTVSGSATGDHLYIGFNGSGGSFNVSLVQLEVGSTATDFQHRSYGDELAKCQRYYQSMDYYYSSGSTSSNGFYYTPLCFPVTMRATPAMTASQWGQNTGNASTYHSSNLVNGWILVSALSTACIVRGNHTNTYNLMAGRGKFDAEL
tara:strand:- start:248 stop:1123 length:876 start_codon:yes stop_codon:yes gene_type:complete